MADSSGKWDDLIVRLVSAVVMIGVGLVAIWFGGWVFGGLVALIGGAMIWELVRLIGGGSQQALLLAGLAGLCLLIGTLIPPGFALPLMMAPAFVGLSRLKAHRTVFMTFSAAILLASYGMVALRQDYGMAWLMWLVLVVVVTDVAGYFAGRMIGGPKFWPRVSPKKTWAGTVAGWVGAALVGLGFAAATTAGSGLMGISIAVAMASQIGDIAESAVKRKAEVKDSSNLIPGHGGLLDRFDGMLGAALFILFVGQLVGLPTATP